MQEPGDSRDAMREVRHARSERLALNRAITSLPAVAATHMPDLGRSISHYHFPTWGFYEIKEANTSRNHAKSRMWVTILCGSGTKARFSANEQAHGPPALRSPELVQRIPHHSLSTPERSSRRNLLRRAKASSILLRKRNPKQPAIWRAAFSSKASSKSCRLVNAKFGIPRS